MMKNKLSNERVEKIMGSLDGMHQAAAPGFFYTRLLGKMQPGEEKKIFFMLRPAFITAALSVFLVVNIFSLLEMKKPIKQQPTVQTNTPVGIESFAKAYDMHTESVYE